MSNDPTLLLGELHIAAQELNGSCLLGLEHGLDSYTASKDGTATASQMLHVSAAKTLLLLNTAMQLGVLKHQEIARISQIAGPELAEKMMKGENNE